MEENILLSLVDDLHRFEDGSSRFDDSSEGQAVHSDTAASLVEKSGTSAYKVSDSDIILIVEFSKNGSDGMDDNYTCRDIMFLCKSDDLVC